MRRLFALLFVANLVGCDKPEPPPPAPAPAVSSVASPVAPAASTPPPPPPPPTPSASGSASAGDCGGKENPCPMQLWMRENVNPPMNRNDMPGLADALDTIAGMAPPGYTNWVSISKDGAAAARNGDAAAAKASCRGCHEQYKQKYKTEMRGRKVPGT